METASGRARAGRRFSALVVAMVAAVGLGGCELVTHAGAPESGTACPAWRGGCRATIDYAVTTSAPTLRAEMQVNENARFASRAAERRCLAFPTGCQLGDLVDTIEDRYFRTVP